jgi:Methylamine utilisation protein MauE
VPALVSSVAVYTVLFVLVVACAAHLSRPDALRRAVAVHGLLPALPVAAVVIACEGVLGGAGIAALVFGSGGRVLVASMAGSGLLFVLFGCYGWYVWSSGRGGPCGCSRSELPMSGWVVVRAFALAGLALVGLLLAGSVLPADRPGTDLIIVLLAAATFACLLWQLPAAMHDPTPVGVRTRPPFAPGRIEGGVVRR